MAYQDPYYASSDNQPYRQRFNEHLNSYYSQETHPTYDSGAYMDDETYSRPLPAAPGGLNGDGANVLRRQTGGKEGQGYSNALPPPMAEPKMSESFKEWRRDHHQNLWTQGSRIRCIGRFCCCTTMIVVFLIVSILLTLGIYIRPPNIVFNGAGLNTNGNTVNVTDNSIAIGLAVNITVDNPNYFSVFVNDVIVQLTYPINSTNVGGGEVDHITFHANTLTNFEFPINLQYVTTNDPNDAVLKDLLSKCGIPSSSTKQQITVDYKLTVGIRALIVTISPTVTNSFSFDCPLTENDVADLLKSVGLNLGDIPGL